MRARPVARPVRSVSRRCARDPTCPAVWTRCTTVRTASSRATSSSSGGTRNGIRAAAIFCLARVIRRATPASPVRRTAAIAATSNPHRRRNVSATCDSRTNAGWQQVKTSRSASTGSSRSPGGSTSSGSLRRSVASRRSRSSAMRCAVVVSQPAGLSGMPCGQVRRARSTASCAQSSARSRSRVRRAVDATTPAHASRKTCSSPVIRPRAAPARAHFDVARRADLREAQRHVEVGCLDHVEAAEGLLGVGEWPVGDQRVAAHRAGGRRRLQGLPTDHARARGAHRLHELLVQPHLVDDGLLVGGVVEVSASYIRNT